MPEMKTDNSVILNRNLCRRPPNELSLAFAAMRKVDKSALGRRVAARRRQLKLSQDALAERIGMKQQGVQSIEDGKVARPRLINELAGALLTSPEWLLWGEGAPRQTPLRPPQPAKQKTGVVQSEQEHINVFDITGRTLADPDRPTAVPEFDVRAGANYGGRIADEEIATDAAGYTFTRDPVRAWWGIPLPFLQNELHARPQRVHILPVRGDSMADVLFDGDRAIIDLDDTDVSQGGIFAVRDDNGSVIIKQVELVRNGEDMPKIRCKSRNPHYEPFELLLVAPVAIIGRVACKITRL